MYYSLVTELDRQLGRLLDHLEETGQLDNTIVLIASDHGRYVGAHGFDHHNFAAFEEIYNIPMIVCGPGVARGEVCDGLVSLADVAPTLIELGGAKPIEGIDGRSFAPLARQPREKTPEYQEAYAEYHGTRFLLTQRILWQGPWKFVFNGFDYDELYNLDDDPHEMHNLAGRPEHRARVEAMMARVWFHATRTEDRAILESHYSPMRFAVVGPNAARQ